MHFMLNIVITNLQAKDNPTNESLIDRETVETYI